MEEQLFNDYVIGELIGQGGFSSVYSAIHKESKKQVAIKMIPKDNDERSLSYVRSEIETLRSMNHPFICELYDVIETQKFIYLVLPYLPNGSLLEYINKNGTLDERQARRIFIQLVEVMKYLHKDMNVVHRDLKLENIMFDNDYNIKLIDFGFSRNVNDDALLGTQCGSIFYCAPEIIKGHHYSFSVDVWSAGVILYVLVAGRFPFDNQNMTQLAQRILYSGFECPKKFSAHFEDIIRCMLEKTPENRIDIDQIVEHPWVNDDIQYTGGKLRKEAMKSNAKYFELPYETAKAVHIPNSHDPATTIMRRTNPIIARPSPFPIKERKGFCTIPMARKLNRHTPLANRISIALAMRK